MFPILSYSATGYLLPDMNRGNLRVLTEGQGCGAAQPVDSVSNVSCGILSKTDLLSNVGVFLGDPSWPSHAETMQSFSSTPRRGVDLRRGWFF
jgi:hypothetical protein